MSATPRPPTRPEWERQQLLLAAQRIARELKKVAGTKRNPRHNRRPRGYRKLMHPRRISFAQMRKHHSVAADIRKGRLLPRAAFEAKTFGGHWRPLGVEEYRDYKAGHLIPDAIRPLTAARKKQHAAAIAWMRSRHRAGKGRGQRKRRVPTKVLPRVRYNMTRLSKHPFYIIAKRGNGPHLAWNGRSFSDVLEPERFNTQGEAARVAGQLWVLHRKIGRLGYQLWVTDQTPATRGARINPERRADVNEAARKFEDFTGRPAGGVTKATLSRDKTTWELGPIRSIEYEATRDTAGGTPETARWHHPFKKRSRPLLTASRDGSQLHIVGGRYEVTDAGIEDR